MDGVPMGGVREPGPEPEPDTKDWTWVLQRRCPECGLDTRDVAPDEVPRLLRQNVQDWLQVLGGPDVRRRPRPGVWSPLEYACHVRDVCRVFDERLRRMLTEDDPHYPSWDQDATAIEARYAEQDPAVVGSELVTAAAALTARFDGVQDEQWQQSGRRSDGARFTVATFARYLVHDPVHHLWDVTGRTAQPSA